MSYKILSKVNMATGDMIGRCFFQCYIEKFKQIQKRRLDAFLTYEFKCPLDFVHLYITSNIKCTFIKLFLSETFYCAVFKRLKITIIILHNDSQVLKMKKKLKRKYIGLLTFFWQCIHYFQLYADQYLILHG